MKLTEAEIEAGRSKKGGYDKKQLAAWGIPWPPPKGWLKALLNGTEIPQQEFATAALKDRHIKTADGDLLHLVVMAVIESGHGDVLAGIEKLNEYYGHQLPTVADVIGGRPEHATIEGGITFDDKVYRFSVVRSTKPKPFGVGPALRRM